MPNGVYSMFQLEGSDVAACFQLDKPQLEQGMPPSWMVYFATGDADASSARVVELGGKLLMPPFDVMDFGRMAVVQDNVGATFSLWQAKSQRGGTTRIGERHTVCWSELATPDLGPSGSFYKSLFGWTMKDSTGAPGPYLEFSVRGQAQGGLLQMDAAWEGIPPNWGIYFLVDDCDGMAQKAAGLGGKVAYGPFDAPGVGRIAVVSDPQGAMFSIIKLNAPM